MLKNICDKWWLVDEKLEDSPTLHRWGGSFIIQEPGNPKKKTTRIKWNDGGILNTAQLDTTKMLLSTFNCYFMAICWEEWQFGSYFSYGGEIMVVL